MQRRRGNRQSALPLWLTPSAKDLVIALTDSQPPPDVAYPAV